MPSAVYLHDGEHQITVTFRTETDRERFKAHYRALDALAVRYRDDRDRLADFIEGVRALNPTVYHDAVMNSQPGASVPWPKDAGR
ncbi:MAG: hypothetical protein LC793_16270 [Thermomicrobia bacterium]|nr:hypothetical protein [Thermomicrobia bacterium]MCA1723028.1 hypothetical protein [Thermomicrobia bacterium]